MPDTATLPPNPHPTYGDITAATPIQRAHIALEDQLIEMRDSRLSMLGPANGLVVREKDGAPSDVIRIPTARAIRAAIPVLLDGIEHVIGAELATGATPASIANAIRAHLMQETP